MRNHLAVPQTLLHRMRQPGWVGLQYESMKSGSELASGEL